MGDDYGGTGLRRDVLRELMTRKLDGLISNEFQAEMPWLLGVPTDHMMTSFRKTLEESRTFSRDGGLFYLDHEARAGAAFKRHAERFSRTTHNKLLEDLPPYDSSSVKSRRAGDATLRSALLLAYNVIEDSETQCRILGSPSRPYVEVSSYPSISMRKLHPEIDKSLSTRWRIEKEGTWTVGSRAFKDLKKKDEVASDTEDFADNEESGDEDDNSDTGEDTELGESFGRLWTPEN